MGGRLETSERQGEKMMKPKEKNRFFTSHLRLKKIYRKSSMQGTQTRTSGVALEE